ncbi:diaminopimelate epimerase [Archaeoglobus sulfaticallidus PM70-1]|uniref:Diaminopimelate epimerase n=1 Tax=Archaeoglobus sulfaticallidus PM70-1 TaxID=387631 RepID=N0BIA7_9EURY|nr:diaminopimelate epimerase [Archaeoglobus sulfaticallidus]AGK60196.1 diaminopimelate epimerase [Archaeoglobus sulfaticallidus PM70-1]
MSKIKFVKLHGNGNDFVLVDEFSGTIIPEDRKPEFVRAVCHRRFGVGADGALFVQRSEKADVRFRYFNSDGSEAEMCGNGIRCFTRYLVDEGYANDIVKVETLAGVLELEVSNGEKFLVKVNMGRVRKRAEDVPVNTEKEFFWGERIGSMEVYAVNSGVPHAVIFVDEIDHMDIIPPARKIRYHELFPHGINVNFVSVAGENELRIRTYERGVEDETLSCGTGSVASAFVAKELGYVSDPVRVITKGGELIIEFDGDIAYMSGSANRVFDGELNLKELRFV